MTADIEEPFCGNNRARLKDGFHQNQESGAGFSRELTKKKGGLVALFRSNCSRTALSFINA
jgi:hypothetical protein